MFLTRRWFIGQSIVTLALFGAQVGIVSADGWEAVLEMVLGAAWAFNLWRWAELRTERRRGWRVTVHEGPEGEPIVDYFGRKL